MHKIIAPAAIAAAITLAGCGGGPPPQPPSVRQVAAQAGATRVSVCGPAPGGGVTDSGVAYRGATRLGIDTFPTPEVRDRWIKTAQGFGVAVLQEGDTWVVYRALDQHTRGCG
jgi:hypothetical protein